MADTEDTETLAAAFSEHEPTDPGCDAALVCSVPEHLASAVLTSSWLAARDERIRADEREKLAGQVGALVDECARSSCIHLNDMYGRIRALSERLAGEVEAR